LNRQDYKAQQAAETNRIAEMKLNAKKGENMFEHLRTNSWSNDQ